MFQVMVLEKKLKSIFEEELRQAVGARLAGGRSLWHALARRDPGAALRMTSEVAQAI
jgi:hypothetical protein